MFDLLVREANMFIILCCVINETISVNITCKSNMAKRLHWKGTPINAIVGCATFTICLYKLLMKLSSTTILHLSKRNGYE